MCMIMGYEWSAVKRFANKGHDLCGRRWDWVDFVMIYVYVHYHQKESGIGTRGE